MEEGEAGIGIGWISRVRSGDVGARRLLEADLVDALDDGRQDTLARLRPPLRMGSALATRRRNPDARAHRRPSSFTP